MIEKIFNVEGMSCDHCVSAVTSAINDLPGVEKVEVSLDDKTAKVYFDENKLDENKIIEAIEDQGFDVV